MNTALLSKLNGDDFRRTVQNRLEDQGAVAGDNILGEFEGDHNLNPGFHEHVIKKAVKAAAVLIPIVERRDGMNVVFTMRTEKLKSHSGQVAFPGGKIDEGDASAQTAALRETHEEIGIIPDAIEILGQMPDYHTGSGYLISPVVGMIDNKAKYQANPHEVEYIFEVPLEFLMNPENHHIGSRVFQNIERHYYEMPWGEHYIWGVTAGIVRMFYNRVFK